MNSRSKATGNRRAVYGIYTHGKLLGKRYKLELEPGVEPLVDKFKQLGFYVNFFQDQFLYPENIAKDNYEWLDYFQRILDERIKGWEPLYGSLAGSIKFMDKAEKFVATVKKAKTNWTETDTIALVFTTCWQ